MTYMDEYKVFLLQYILLLYNLFFSYINKLHDASHKYLQILPNMIFLLYVPKKGSLKI